jgi:hypothetical protein
VKFVVDRSRQTISNSALVYRPADYSLDTEPSYTGGFTSALINDLNLELDKNGKVVSVWGMCPATRWLEKPLVPPDAEHADIFLIPDSPLVRGVAVNLVGGAYLSTYVDWASGWVCVEGSGTPSMSIEILPSVRVQIDSSGQFCALWLRPKELPASPQC